METFPKSPTPSEFSALEADPMVQPEQIALVEGISSRLGQLEELIAQARTDIFDKAQYLQKNRSDALEADIEKVRLSLNDAFRAHDLLDW